MEGLGIFPWVQSLHDLPTQYYAPYAPDSDALAKSKEKQQSQSIRTELQCWFYEASVM